MKHTIRKVLASVIVLTLVMGALGGALAATFPSKAFKLPAVAHRPTADPTVEPTLEPEITEAPVEENPDAPAEEIPAEPVEEIPGEPTEETPEAPVEENPDAPMEEISDAPLEEISDELLEEIPEDVLEEAPEEESISLEGLRTIIVLLPEGESSVELKAEPSEGAETLASIPAGTLLYVKEINSEWSYAVYGEIEGYVLTSKIALYNSDATPEEEEIIRTVSVSSSLEGLTEAYVGTEVVLTAKLTGFEDVNYHLQWQYTPDGGATLIDIDGANGLEYHYILDDETYSYLYRLVVSVEGPAEEAGPQAEAPVQE